MSCIAIRFGVSASISTFIEQRVDVGGTAAHVGFAFAKKPPIEAGAESGSQCDRGAFRRCEGADVLSAYASAREGYGVHSGLFDGERQVLCNKPRYDFNWRMTYQLAEPILLPKGMRILVNAHYDNSPNNPANPNPKADVSWGKQSWDEMLAGFMDFAIPVNMNPARIAGPEKTVTVAAAGAN
jgi:hypothetical protein